MSESEFEKTIARLLNRAAWLKQVQAGSAKLRRVRVKSYTVPEHQVSSHWRYIAPPRQRQVTARKLGVAA